MHLLALLATLVALASGPLLYALARPRPALLAFLDGFTLVSIAGLVLLEVLPGTYGEGGAWSLAFVALGAVGPSLVERTLHHARREAHLATLALAVLGLLLHSLADGAALAPGAQGDHAHHAHEALALAVVVHSIPVGLVVWWVMAPVFGWRWPAFTLALMGAGTLLGYAFGFALHEWLGTRALAWFQALVAGSILHVVFGRPHLEEDSVHRAAEPPWEGLGNAVALLGLFALSALDPHAGQVEHAGTQFIALALWLAPLVLLAYVMWGLRSAMRAPDTRLVHRLRRGLRSTLVEAVDASAARLLALLLIALGALLLAGLRLPHAGCPRAAAALCALLAGLFLASLLRMGGRGWLASVTGVSRHRH